MATPIPETYQSAREALAADTPARRRLGLLFDPDSFVELDPFLTAEGEPCGVVCGYGAVMGSPACAFSQTGGGIGKAEAAKLSKLYGLALKTGVPVVGIYDSAGARVSEGAAALSAYGEILLHINNLSGVVPQLSFVAGVCAGSSAMMACSADFLVMTEEAQFFMTPPDLAGDGTEGAGTAKNAALAGVAHLVTGSEMEACVALRQMLSLLPLNNLASPPQLDFAAPTAPLPQSGAGLSCEETVAAFADDGSLIPLLAEFGENACIALGTLGGSPAGFVAAGGGLDADSCVKIAKLVSVCDAYQLPVITFVNTTGFAPSAKAELCGSVRDMAKLAHVYAEATTAKLAVVTGRAVGSAYVALASRAANADYTLAWPDAVISPLATPTAVAFLYGDKITAGHSRAEAEQDYEKTEASAMAAAAGGHIDDVVPPHLTRPALLSALDLLAAKRVTKHPKKHSNLPL